jgi:hypothetical protein
MKYLLLVTAFLSFNVFAHELSFTPYLKMQESLAADNFKDALAAHKTICDQDLKHYKDDYKDCGKKFKDIEELRASFKPLSELYMKKGNQKEMKGLTVVNCPMYPGKWVQRNGKIANPFYGKGMLECGEKL